MGSRVSASHHEDDGWHRCLSTTHYLLFDIRLCKPVTVKVGYNNFYEDSSSDLKRLLSESSRVPRIQTVSPAQKLSGAEQNAEEERDKLDYSGIHRYRYQA